jgi:streptomycin 6-kinase
MTNLIELTKAGRDDKATRIFCQIARQLHSAKGSSGNFRSIAELASGFDRRLGAGNRTISNHEVRRAKALYLSLITSQAPPVLLHGDLHHDNIPNNAAWLGGNWPKRLCRRTNV